MSYNYICGNKKKKKKEEEGLYGYLKKTESLTAH